MKNRVLTAVVAALMGMPAIPAMAADEHFDIAQFAVEGNTLLPEDLLNQKVMPFVGKGRVYGDIQKALEAIEAAYRSAGYNSVQVYVPEQELTSGVVRIQVTEGVIGKVLVSGNSRFSNENIRASLPHLQEGKTPNARQLSENIQLANENPAKQVEVTLALGEQEGQMNAKVNVTEQNPQRFFVTVDDTGTGATGHIRTGLAYQNANLMGGDEVLTAAYTTSPDAPTGVSVDIYSLAFRKPFYDLGDSLDLIYADSNVNTPTITSSVGAIAVPGMSGKGNVFGVRWNHLFPRQGEYSSKLVFGYDYKYFNTRCAGFAPGVLASCTPHTTRPVSATYSGQWQNPGYVADFNVGLAYNLPLGGKHVEATTGTVDNYSFIAGRTKVDDDFLILRAGGSYTLRVGDWQVRGALNSQWAEHGLVAGEQLGLAGSTAVRGFNERAAAADTGYVGNLEAYSPDYAAVLGVPGNVRGIVFYDFAQGWNNNALATVPKSVTVASWGVGLRYGLDKDVTLRVDLAQVVDHGTVASVSNGSWRGHFGLNISF